MTQDKIIHQIERKIEPTTLVIFGATGDLATKRLLPALYHLYDHNLLPKSFSIIGFALTDFSSKKYLKIIKETSKKWSGNRFSEKSWKTFEKIVTYSPGSFDKLEDFETLKGVMDKLEHGNGSKHQCRNRLYYYSTIPRFYETISEQLDKSGLLADCGKKDRTIRVLIEKPFGRDLKTAKALDQTLSKYFTEDQVYRIDHYLGKETVQNFLTTRFANNIFEPIWNHRYIDHVQISVLEEVGVLKRGAFFEQTGAFRDFVQNHLMQLLALTAMEPPQELSAKAIRDERLKVINSIRIPKINEVKNILVPGQYAGYRREENVSPTSIVETYVAIKLFVDNNRWAGVPFYLRNGKNLKKKVSEVSIHFKPAAQFLFDHKQVEPNVLTFREQPSEGIFFQMIAKQPGFGTRLKPVNLELGYKETFLGEIPEAYERLILDFIQGDQRLFARLDEILASWELTDVIEEHLQSKKRSNLAMYKPQSWGPKEADDLLAKDGRKWWNTTENS